MNNEELESASIEPLETENTENVTDNVIIETTTPNDVTIIEESINEYV